MQPLVADEPLVLEEPVEHYVLAVAAEIQSLLKENRTRHPPIRASKREKITDLIDLLLSTNVENKIEVQK